MIRDLGTVDVCGRSFKVRKASAAENTDLANVYGVCDFHAGVIWLSSDYARSDVDTLVHEIIHAIFDGSGLRNWLEQRLPRGANVNDCEEEFTGIFTPHIVSALVSAGWRPPEKIGRKARGKR